MVKHGKLSIPRTNNYDKYVEILKEPVNLVSTILTQKYRLVNLQGCPKICKSGGAGAIWAKNVGGQEVGVGQKYCVCGGGGGHMSLLPPCFRHP